MKTTKHFMDGQQKLGSWTLQLMSKGYSKDTFHTAASFSAEAARWSIPLPQQGWAPMAL